MAINKNDKFEKFLRITLKGNPENNFTLPGKQIINLILSMLKEERNIAIEEIRSIIKEEFDKAEYNSEMAKWKGANIDEMLFEEIKKKVLFRVNEKLKKFK